MLRLCSLFPIRINHYSKQRSGRSVLILCLRTQLLTVTHGEAPSFMFEPQSSRETLDGMLRLCSLLSIGTSHYSKQRSGQSVLFLCESHPLIYVAQDEESYCMFELQASREARGGMARLCFLVSIGINHYSRQLAGRTILLLCLKSSPLPV